MRKACFIFLFGLLSLGKAQNYPPAAGQPGSTAIFKDSSVFVNWANACSVKRGYVDVSNPGLGYASAGDSSLALGKAGENGVLSLGDGGWATCSFPFPIRNGPGFDFAVFENGFDDFFLELAAVEVSSDGIHFFAFPAHSLTDTLVQKGPFDSLDAKRLNNLAGKYRGGYGTPFDLQELQGQNNLDIQSVSHVRVIDVVGALYQQYATRDAYQNKINDPWPTPFPSGGFDLDAIGVIHQNTYLAIKENENEIVDSVFPNPIRAGETLYFNHTTADCTVKLISSLGIAIPLFLSNQSLQIPDLQAGVYHLEIITDNHIFYKKILVEN
ncbi:MAG: T9SS type A sorting domain-containing protein [Bacteroidia bacterium]|nr:T9SS type A sorting domain-containing protein [Bacteroidia bacterium]